MAPRTNQLQEEPPYEEALARSAQLLYDILADFAAKESREQQRATKPTSRDEAESLPDRVTAALVRHGPLSPLNLRALLGCAPMTLSRTLRQLSAAGRIAACGSTRARKYSSPLKRSDGGPRE